MLDRGLGMGFDKSVGGFIELRFQVSTDLAFHHKGKVKGMEVVDDDFVIFVFECLQALVFSLEGMLDELHDP